MFIMFYIFIFFLHRFTTGSLYLYLSPEPCEACVTTDGCALLTTFGLLKKTPAYCYSKAWKSKDNLLYNSDWIHLKEESHNVQG